MLMQWIQKVMIVSLALAVKAGSGIQYEKVLAGSQFVSFSSCSSDWLFTNNTATGVQATSVTGVSVSYGDLYINNAHGYHEGLYTCSNDPNAATNVTVYAAPKFHGCSTTNCNLGTTVTVPEGQSTLLNISLDYVNGGPSGAKQSMQAVVLKRNGLSGSLLYCNTGSPDCSIKKPFIQNYTQTTTASNHTFSLRTSNVAISDSGVYVAKVELNDIYNKNKITVITSSFTISVTPTPSSSYGHKTATLMTTPCATLLTSTSSLLPTPSPTVSVQCNTKYKYDIYLCSEDLIAIINEDEKSVLLYEWAKGSKTLEITRTSLDSFRSSQRECLSQYKGSTTKARVNGIQKRELKRAKIANCKENCAGLVAKMLRLVDQPGCN